MRLVDEQIHTFEREGWLLLTNVFSSAEVDLMKRELCALLQESSPARILERDATTVRSLYGSHAHNDVFGCLARDIRLVEPMQQLLRDDVYVHQFKINTKVGLGDGSWSWHQDYIFWLREDGMPDARAINAAVFLDDVTEFNGPMFLIPGSHVEGVLETPINDVRRDDWTYRGGPTWIANVISTLKYSLERDTVRHLVARYGLVAPKGEAGSVLLFHCNLAHCSGPNMSPFDRALAFVTFNSVQNALRPVTQPRPEFLASRDFRPVVPTPTFALLDARRSLPQCG